MSLTDTVIERTLNPDGTLVLDQKPNLPPGRVTVRMRPVAALPDGDPFFDMLKGIWAAQKARGHVARTEAEVERERQENREAWAERQQEIERVQEESRRLREQQL